MGALWCPSVSTTPAAVILNPASLLLAWLALALAMQWLPLPALMGATVLVLPAVWRFSRRRLLILLRRARWLLLSIALLFALATPGAALPGPAGMLGLTYEGILLAATHVLRLTLLLALLALLLDHLGIPALVSGLYLLLKPFGESRARRRLALRLLLVLEYVENSGSTEKKHWRDSLNPQGELAEYPPLHLAVAPLAGIDYFVMALALLGLCGVWGWWGVTIW